MTTADPDFVKGMLIVVIFAAAFLWHYLWNMK